MTHLLVGEVTAPPGVGRQGHARDLRAAGNQKHGEHPNLERLFSRASSLAVIEKSPLAWVLARRDCFPKP